jgi:hypothetical protein
MHDSSIPQPPPPMKHACAPVGFVASAGVCTWNHACISMGHCHINFIFFQMRGHILWTHSQTFDRHLDNTSVPFCYVEARYFEPAGGPRGF